MLAPARLSAQAGSRRGLWRSGSVADFLLRASPHTAIVSALKTIVHLGGRFVAEQDAVVSLFDPGYLLGEGTFATLRGYEGICFRAERHVAMLARGAAMLGLDPPSSPEELVMLADEAAGRTEAANAYVRITLTRGAPGAGPVLSIIARAMNVPTLDAYTHGIDAVTVTPRRVPPACLDGTVKTTSYVVQVLARREVDARGAAEGIQLAIDGALAGGTMSSLFLIRGGQLLTPSLESGCRAGVTREVLLEIASRVGLRAAEVRLEPADIESADEAFFASTRIECLPIARVDGHAIGCGTFSRTAMLRNALSAVVREEATARRAAR